MNVSDALILGFIRTFTEKHGYPPTMREIGKGVGLRSSATVHWHIQQLVARGLISYVRGSPRTIRVLTIP